MKDNLLADGDLYAWGANSECQLGCNDKQDKSTPILVSIPNKKILTISCGMLFSAALVGDLYLQTMEIMHAISEPGDIFTWGDNNFGQLGQGNMGTPTASLRQVVGLPCSATAISCGYSHMGTVLRL